MTPQDDSAGGYILPSTEEEAQRLEGQARLYGGVAFLEPFLAVPPGAILDVGCGSGHFTRHVAARCPQTAVVGLDADASRLDFARGCATASNPSYEQGDVTALPFEEGRFDLAFCRFLLVHLSDPVAALREMARVVRPGGRVVAYDLIHEGIWFSPPKPALEQLLATTMAILRERGAEPNQGVHAPLAMQRAGLQEVGVQVIPHCAISAEPSYDAYRENWRATVRHLAEGFGERFAAGLVARALQELAPSAEPQLMLEITVLAHGTKG